MRHYNMLSIGITTFKRRLQLLKNLIKQIRHFDKFVDILVTVNGDNDAQFDESYRKDLLNFMAQTDNVFPIFFPSFSGLSKMWNTLIIHSPTEHILILNDDIILNEDSNIFPTISEVIQREELFVLNDSWAHFVISKKIAYLLKYFDERLLAFGEEDGDMVWRFIQMFGKPPPDVIVRGISNICEGYHISPTNIETCMVGRRQVPKFNRYFMFNHKYRFTNNAEDIKGMFDAPCQKLLQDVQQYPYEEFKEKNKWNIKKVDKTVL